MNFKTKMTEEGLKVIEEKNDPKAVLKGLEAFEEAKRVFGLLFHENQRLSQMNIENGVKTARIEDELQNTKAALKEKAAEAAEAVIERDKAVSNLSRAQEELSISQARIADLEKELEETQLLALDHKIAEMN